MNSGSKPCDNPQPYERLVDVCKNCRWRMELHPPTAPAVPDELREKCAEIQILTQLDDPAWERTFGNKKGLYGFVTQYARQERLDELEDILNQRTVNMQKFGANMSEDDANNLTVQRMEQVVAQLTATPHEGEEKK